MLRELFDRIVEMAIATHKIQTLPVPDPRNVRLLVGNDFHGFPIPRPDHKQTTVEIPSDLFAAIHQYAPAADSSVWHNENAIRAVLDDTDRRESIHIDLRPTDTRLNVEQLPKAFDPKTLVRFIRRDLAGAIDPTAADPFRAVDFSRRDETQIRNTKEQESLGRQIHATVGGALPEYLTLSLRWYANAGIPYRAPVRLSVEPDATNGTITLAPLADAMQEALSDVQQQLHEALEQLADTHHQRTGQQVTVFQGYPVFA